MRFLLSGNYRYHRRPCRQDSFWIFLQGEPVSLKDYFSDLASLAQVVARETAFPLFLILTYLIPAILLNQYLRRLPKRSQDSG